jgi:hypothetical protein
MSLYPKPPANLDPSASPVSEADEPGALVISLMMAGVLGLAAAIACAVLWGVIAYFTGRIFLIGAILIGMAVTFATTVNFRRVTLPIGVMVFLLSLALTFFSVIVGDLLFYVLSAGRELELGFADAFRLVMANAIEIITDPEEIMSYFFAGLGALLGFYNVMRRR